MGQFSFKREEKYDGPPFVGGEEKQAISKGKVPFEIVACAKVNGQYGWQYFLTVVLDNEQRTMPFSAGSVQSRDEQFDQLIEFFEENGEDHEPIVVVLVKGGTGSKAPWLLEDAE